MEANPPAGKRNSSTPPPRLTLSKISHVRAELAKLYREARQGKVALSDATRLTFMLQVLGRLIADHEFEQRLAAVEQEAKNAKTRF